MILQTRGRNAFGSTWSTAPPGGVGYGWIWNPAVAGAGTGVASGTNKLLWFDKISSTAFQFYNTGAQLAIAQKWGFAPPYMAANAPQQDFQFGSIIPILAVGLVAYVVIASVKK